MEEEGEKGGTVLIVEDNDMNLKLVCDVLRFGGFDTIEAKTGAEGVEMAKLCHPDVVIMDVQLPDFDGWEALRKIRNDPETSEVVVVAVTAFATRGDERHYLEGGFDGYLTKPIDVASFPDAIRRFCAPRRPRRGC